MRDFQERFFYRTPLMTASERTIFAIPFIGLKCFRNIFVCIFCQFNIRATTWMGNIFSKFPYCNVIRGNRDAYIHLNANPISLNASK